MAKKEHLLAAVDIGTTKIVVIVGKQTENKKLEILGMSQAASKGVKRGVVLNIEETVNAIDSTVTEVKKQTGLIRHEPGGRIVNTWLIRVATLPAWANGCPTKAEGWAGKYYKKE